MGLTNYLGPLKGAIGIYRVLGLGFRVLITGIITLLVIGVTPI